MEEQTPKRLWNRRFVSLFAIEAALQIGGFMSRPIISNFAVELGATIPLAGFLAGIYATAALVMRPFSGGISDRFAKKQLLTFACFLYCIGAFGCSFARNPLILGTFLCLQGFAFAFKSTIVVSVVPSMVPHNRIGMAVGWIGLAYTLGMALGPALGSVVSDYYGYVSVFLCSGIFMTLAFVFTLFLKIPKSVNMSLVEKRMIDEKDAGYDDAQLASEILDEELSSKDDIKDIGNPVALNSLLRDDIRQRQTRKKKNGLIKALEKCFYFSALPLSIAAGFLMIAQGSTSSFVLMAGQMEGVADAALYFTFYSFATLAARPLAGRLSDIYGLWKVAPPAMAIAICGMLSIAFIPNIVGFAIGGVCMGAGQASAYSNIQAESVRDVPDDQLGRSANTFFIFPDLAMGVGPVFGGAVLQGAGPQAMFVFNAIMIAVAICVLFLVRAFSKRHAN